MSIEHYNTNAQDFFDGTVNADLSLLYKPFLRFVSDSGHILDAGSGSGRDSRAFLNMGYQVTSMDASDEMVRLSSEMTGQSTLKMSFQEMTFKDMFDGVWACASLLHVPPEEMDDVLNRIVQSLKTDGAFYCSFKVGTGVVKRDDRMFTLFTEETLLQQVAKHSTLVLKKIWKTQDVRAGRQGEEWVNGVWVKGYGNT